MVQLKLVALFKKNNFILNIHIHCYVNTVKYKASYLVALPML